MTPLSFRWRRILFRLGSAAVLVGTVPTVDAQPNYATPIFITTLAGSGAEGSADGAGTAATFDIPWGLAVDSSRNIYVADVGSGRIRKITPAGVVTTLAATNGTTTVTPLFLGQIRTIAIDASRNLYVSGYTIHTIRKITPVGVVSDIAGQNNTSGSADGAGTAARFNGPMGLAVDSSGNLFVADRDNHTIRRITPAGAVTTLAGLAGSAGTANGTGSAARFRFPEDIALDAAGNLYVADSGNHTIRRVTPAGVVTTFAGTAGIMGSLDATGTAALFSSPRGIAVGPGGNVYISNTGNQTIRKITPAGVVTTLAGTPFSSGSADGLGADARFQTPLGLAVDSLGTLYVVDGNNRKIRRSATPPTAVFIAGTGSVTLAPGASATLASGATSDFPLTFQWRKDGIAIPGATASQTPSPGLGTSQLLIANAQAADAGRYTAAVTNFLGTVVSPEFNVTVLVPPVITAQPANQVVTQTEPFRFSVSVSPQVGPTFVWRKNGVAIPGATSATFEKTSATLDDAGQYSVVVTHAGTSITSTVATLTVTEAPTVTAPPSHVTNAGVTVLFGATVSPATATIQWRKDGVPIAGATTSVLILTNVTLADSGSYEVAATSGGVTASATTSLIVNVPPTILTQPASQTVTLGQPAQFSVTVAPAIGPTFQWRKNGVAISGATNSTFTIPAVSTGDAGSYSVVVTRNGLSVTSNGAALTVNVPVSGQPVTHTVFVGSPVNFNFTSTPAPGTTFQWRKEGVPVAGATNASFSIPSAALADAGNYTVVFTLGGVSQTSNTATLIVLPLAAPVITAQPSSRTGLIGATVQFSVGASSTTPLSFQWRRDGAPISGATTEILTLNNVQTTNAGTYSVVVTNAGGSVTSDNATLTVNSPSGTAPVITTHPVGQTIIAGATITLSVSAGGTSPLAFQWYRNGTGIPGATTPLLSINNAQASDEAGYAVVVSNSAGIATSNAAAVQVIVPPAISIQPAPQSVVAGDSVQFSVTAAGTAPLSFQWHRDGTPIAGATNGALTLNSVGLADGGTYSVLVTNSAGAATSSGARLNVAPPPPTARLSNVSVRTTLPVGQAVIVGLAVDGGARDVLVRAIGPSLASFGVGSVMADPRLELFRGEVLMAANEDWPVTLSATFAGVGAFPLPVGSRDAALLQSLSGAFSVQARGSGGGTVLVEAFAVGAGSPPRLVNISARNRVGTGDDILIAGFVISGTGRKSLLIRAVGPGLAAFNVPATLADPRIEVFTTDGNSVAQNDNWSDTLEPLFTSVGAFGLTPGSRDAALFTSLPVGSYTVQVRGADGGTGEAIVEIYEVP